MAVPEGTGHLGGDFRPLELGGLDLLGAEEVRGGDAAEGAPVDTVRGKTDGAVEHEAVSRFLDWTISKDRAGENLLGHIRMARDYGACVSEAERHESHGVACFGRRKDTVVREGGHEFEAPDHRVASGTGNDFVSIRGKVKVVGGG